MEILPGTEIMADVGSHHFVKGGSTVLVPQPSDDPADPLNWSPWIKFSAILATNMVTFSQGFGPLALAPMFGSYIEAFDCTLAEAVQFTGVCILVLGFSNFLWYALYSTSLSFRSLDTGYQSARHSAADQSSSSPRSFVWAPASGVPVHRPMAASWALVLSMA